MDEHRRYPGLPLLPPRLPGVARVGRVPVGRTVDLPGRGSTYVFDAGPVTDGFSDELGLCLSTEGVPVNDYRHRRFWTDLDTGVAEVLRWFRG